jgi:hypothetical protein
MTPLPTETYLHTLTRLRYLDAAMHNLPESFAPDGHDADYVAGLVTSATDAYKELGGKFNAGNLAVGALQEGCAECHDAAIAVYTCMKACYRTDVKSRHAIRSLPKNDRTPERTLSRMRTMADLWATLPNVPGTTGPLKVGAITQASFAGMVTIFEAKVKTAKLAESTYAGALAGFHAELDTWDKFVSAALVQGRSLFKEGTAERAYLDRVPTEPASTPPGPAVITLASSPAHGAVRLEFNAEHATSFKVIHKGPGQLQFTPVADVLAPGVYMASGLAGGFHMYKIAGVNSRGDGPESAEVSLAVAAAQAA